MPGVPLDVHTALAYLRPPCDQAHEDPWAFPWLETKDGAVLCWKTSQELKVTQCWEQWPPCSGHSPMAAEWDSLGGSSCFPWCLEAARGGPCCLGNADVGKLEQQETGMPTVQSRHRYGEAALRPPKRLPSPGNELHSLCLCAQDVPWCLPAVLALCLQHLTDSSDKAGQGRTSTEVRKALPCVLLDGVCDTEGSVQGFWQLMRRC